jgi:uncharacterized protein YcfJ
MAAARLARSAEEVPMRLPVFFTIVAVIALGLGGVAEAQDKPADLRSVLVQLKDTATMIKARLVSMDANSVTLLVKNHRTSLPLDRVVRITARRRDSVWNGAVIGALIGGVMCARSCGQGLNSAGELPLAVASAAAGWGAAGAGIDAMNRREEIIYERRR